MANAESLKDAVKNHYDRMLGPVYSWIIGDFDTACRMNTDLLASLGLRSDRGAVALDLGCGPGCQSVPLANAGFKVTAIDFCESLLAELQFHAGKLPIRAVHDDILNFPAHITDSPELIVCMGDTLVHLPDVDAVENLISDICDRLQPGGTFVASLRDYSLPPPCGAARFLPVRNSEDRIFTCFLEYRGDTIEVHDILHARVDGEWRLHVSQYQKLRLDYRLVIGFLQDRGMAVDSLPGKDGMIVIKATKPA